MFEQSVTVYNYYKDPVTRNEYWYRSIIENVQWTQTQERTVTAAGVVNLANLMQLIFQLPTNKPYVAPIDYAKLPADIMPQYFTLDPRSGTDLIVLTPITQEITTTYTIAKLKTDYGYVTISSNADYRHIDGHLEVICK